MSEAAEITRGAKSNLAFALRMLPRERREDMVVFYAFCRTMDDLADEPSRSIAERRALLEAWKHGLAAGFVSPDELQRQVIDLVRRREIPAGLLMAIVSGCEEDLDHKGYETWLELDAYIWKVACAVGLVSVRIFGCVDPGAEAYAEALGRALQLTNILRDIREDAGNGRLYLPREDLERFGCSASDWQRRAGDSGFLKLMDFEARRAEGFFHSADKLLPAVDRRALVSARVMAEIYHLLLERMRRDGFRVWEKRYRISTMRKLIILAQHLIAR